MPRRKKRQEKSVLDRLRREDKLMNKMLYDAVDELMEDSVGDLFDEFSDIAADALVGAFTLGMASPPSQRRGRARRRWR